MKKLTILLALCASAAFGQRAINFSNSAVASAGNGVVPTEFQALYTEHGPHMAAIRNANGLNVTPPFNPYILFGEEALPMENLANFTSSAYAANVLPYLQTARAMGVQGMKVKWDVPMDLYCPSGTCTVNVPNGIGTITFPNYYDGTQYCVGSGSYPSCTGGTAIDKSVTAYNNRVTYQRKFIADAAALGIQIQVQSVIAPITGGSQGDIYDNAHYLSGITFNQYIAMRVLQVQNVALLLPTGGIAIAGELGNEGSKAGIPNITSGTCAVNPTYCQSGAVIGGSGWITNIYTLLTSVELNLEALQTAGTISGLHTSMKIAAGVEPWLDLTDFNRAMPAIVAMPGNDMITIHCHTMNAFTGDDSLQQVVVEIKAATAAGKPSCLNEQGAYYENAAEALGTQVEANFSGVPTVEARNNLDFWAPLDLQFMLLLRDMLNAFAPNQQNILYFSMGDRWRGMVNYYAKGGNGSNFNTIHTPGAWDGLNNDAVTAALAANPFVPTENGRSFMKISKPAPAPYNSFVQPMAMDSYGSADTASNIWPVNNWIGHNFQQVIGTSSNEANFNGTPPHTQYLYTDSAYWYADAIKSLVKDVATANSFASYEDMMLHSNQDYAVSNGWYQMGCFDVFEQTNWQNNGAGSCSQAVNGAFTLVGSTYTDVTAALYAGPTVGITDRLQIGYGEPFDIVTVTLGTALSGGTLSYQYWNGSAWTNLTLVSDGSSGLTASGTIKFTPPANWAPRVVNGSYSKYWIQITVSGASTAPVIQARGDNWISTVSGMTNRGWNPTASGIVNASTYPYNPTPPANATARFRYQARLEGLFASNSTFLNPANIQNGKITQEYSFLTAFAQNFAALTFNVNGAFFDDAAQLPTWSLPASTPVETLTAPELNGTTFYTANSAYIAATTKQLKVVHGSTFKIAINNPHTPLYAQTDAEETENFGNTFPMRSGNGSTTILDSYLNGPNNPAATTGLIQMWDNAGFMPISETEGSNSATYQWDMADRSPVAVLATMLIEGNANTALLYDTCGFCYPYMDHYYAFTQTGPTISTSLAVNTTYAEKDFTLANDTAVAVAGGQWTNTTAATSASQAICTPTNAPTGCGSGITEGTPISMSGGGYAGYIIRIDGNVLQAFRLGSHQWRTFSPIFNAITSGDAAPFAAIGHQSLPPLPALSSVWYWGNYAPVFATNVGTPTSARNLTFRAASGTNPETWKRSFTYADVYFHAMHDGSDPNQISTYDSAISLGGSFYRLHADGSTDATAITTIQLRASEGAILCRHPKCAAQ